MSKAKTLIVFTNRNSIIFDEAGEQMGELQAGINCYSLDPVLAQRACDEAREFFIARWSTGEKIELRKLEMEYLLGLRTIERDLKDQMVTWPAHLGHPA